MCLGLVTIKKRQVQLYHTSNGYTCCKFSGHNVGMLTAGMFTRAAGHELNVHFTPISCLQCCFREFGSASELASQPQTTWNSTRPGPQHPASSQASASLFSSLGCWPECNMLLKLTWGGKWRISVYTVTDIWHRQCVLCCVGNHHVKSKVQSLIIHVKK